MGIMEELRILGWIMRGELWLFSCAAEWCHELGKFQWVLELLGEQLALVVGWLLGKEFIESEKPSLFPPESGVGSEYQDNRLDFERRAIE